MNLMELQAELRHFAAERDWQPFHTPKNLTTALMVEASELGEIFQWMTPEQSVGAHETPATKQAIGAEVADVLLYLLQVADHCAIDVEHAVRAKVAANAQKYPAKRKIVRASPEKASASGTHVLLDFENVQPTEAELRALVPEASQVWVFHGPHQKQVAERFASYGDRVTPVPISKTGKNALDFHLAFYMGYIASRNQAGAMVVVANDKGYEPMLAHAKSMGFAVRQVGFGAARPAAPAKKVPAAKKAVVARKVAAKKVAAKKATAAPALPRGVPTASEAVAKAPTAKGPSAKKTSTKKSVQAATSAKATAGGSARRPPEQAAVAPASKSALGKPVAKKAVAKTTAPAPSAAGLKSAAHAAPPPASQSGAFSAEVHRRISAALSKMGGNRPAKAASLRRTLKSLLGVEAGHPSIEEALRSLVDSGVLSLGPKAEVAYPGLK